MVNKNEILTSALKKHFGFDSFKGNQEVVIQNVMNGKDTFVHMPTGEESLYVTSYLHY